MTRLCDKNCVYENLWRLQNSHLWLLCEKSSVENFPPVYSVKYLDATKHQNTTSHLMEGNLLIQIDRGSIYYPFLFAYTSWQIKDILIMTTFFGCKIFVHKSCHMIHLLFKIDLYIYKQYKLLICKSSWVEGVYAVSIEALPPHGVYPIWVNLFQTPSLILKEGIYRYFSCLILTWGEMILQL